MVKQISDNEIHLLIKYIKIVLWRVAKRLSYIEDGRCLKFNFYQATRLSIPEHRLCLRFSWVYISKKLE